MLIGKASQPILVAPEGGWDSSLYRVVTTYEVSSRRGARMRPRWFSQFPCQGPVKFQRSRFSRELPRFVASFGTTPLHPGRGTATWRREGRGQSARRANADAVYRRRLLPSPTCGRASLAPTLLRAGVCACRLLIGHGASSSSEAPSSPDGAFAVRHRNPVP